MSQRNCHLSPQTNGNPRIFAGFLGHLSLFLSSAGGQLVPPYDLKSQKGQIEGIIRFYAASATCQGDKLKWTPTCQGTNCGARMFPGFLLNLSLFLSSALGATFGWPSPSSLTRVHLPQRGRRDLAFCKLLVAHLLGSPSGAATSRWDVAQRPVSAAASVGAGRLPLADSTRGGSRDAGTAAAVTERANQSCPPAGDRKSDKLSKNPGNMRAPQFVP